MFLLCYYYVVIIIELVKRVNYKGTDRHPYTKYGCLQSEVLPVWSLSTLRVVYTPCMATSYLQLDN